MTHSSVCPECRPLFWAGVSRGTGQLPAERRPLYFLDLR
jgi:hypothetical protein